MTGIPVGTTAARTVPDPAALHGCRRRPDGFGWLGGLGRGDRGHLRSGKFGAARRRPDHQVAPAVVASPSSPVQGAAGASNNPAESGRSAPAVPAAPASATPGTIGISIPTPPAVPDVVDPKVPDDRAAPDACGASADPPAGSTGEPARSPPDSPVLPTAQLLQCPGQ
ncbi:hypothetical protein HEP84_49865 [Streptomyces sp. RLB1-33]|nr:hypothetical protein [Streptomyces sp. RLB1-33]QIY75889.1 hypothetical protein HEP84_49865 [Streptomyces sp. RLB1-33]